MFPYNSIKVPLFVSHRCVLLLMRKLLMMKWGQQWKAAIGSELIICLGQHRTRKNYIRKRKMLLNDKQIWCLTAVRGVGGRRKNVLAFSIPSAGLVCLSVQWIFSWKSFRTAQARPLTNISISRHLIVLARLQRHSWMFSINFTQKNFNWISHMFLNFTLLSLALHDGQRCRHDKE